MKTTLNIRIFDIKCGGCLSRIERAVQITGGDRFDYDFSTSKAQIEYQSDLVLEADFCKAIEKAGYHAVKIFVNQEKEE